MRSIGIDYNFEYIGGRDDMAGTIISGVIFGIVAIIIFGIGISQLKSKDPVGFYTGEKPPKSQYYLLSY